MNKEIRRRIKIIDSMPSEESAMKIIYLRAAEINDKWSMRSGKCSRIGNLHDYTRFGTLWVLLMRSFLS